ncbi:PLP-dependent aminotransferase family protein [Acetobacter sp. TBRC 12305]|uniref:PLP-dependent aminotransferase family protein n=1 Tax=Acetobacter garciniae TaxID=2817435 RepID=A0A939HH35_9PROT|nr:PLP-dependent aminotransferase family protein [Acetobacter garciniae]MBO1324283.1 PLP-dependent aminotransferase family protein [Acetobacter garciniae]MBX0343972.1 PLP-dependent aminotransferase family protein [Acetobacter garciniae]
MPTTLKRPGAVLDIPLPLDRAAGGQALQVHAGLRAAILDGRLAAGLRLPSTRALAQQLHVKRNAVVIAYEHLQSDGLAEARTGSGTFVAALPATARHKSTTKALSTTIKPLPGRVFALGKTYADPRLLGRLATAMRRRIMKGNDLEFSFGDPRGHPLLREQVARYLAANRGVICDPACVVIINGTQQGLRLCAQALLHPGDTVWVEDPGYPAARATLAASGLNVCPVPVDAEGLDVSQGAARAAGARAVYVTPSHQFPSGVTMSMNRRAALVAWARASNAWILEDDYDSEFRYAGPPLTALAGIGGGDRVIYLGTFSKILAPGLRLAYMVVSPDTVEAIVAARAGHDRFPPGHMAGAVAELMEDGFVAEHIRRMRRRYRIARDTVVATLRASAAGALDVVTPEQGLHLLARLPPGLPDDAATHIRKRAGVEARLLAETYAEHAPSQGFILGFSGHDLHDLTSAAGALGQAARNYCNDRG